MLSEAVRKTIRAKSPPRRSPGGLPLTNCVVLNQSEIVGSKHQLHPRDDFIELVLAKLRIRLAEIRPGMHIVHHEFDIVSVNIVVEASQDRIETVIPPLAGV